jgi:hypothetical protein
MKEYSRKLLDKALDAIEAAEMLVDGGKSDIGAGRAYYAMFYVAEALLNEKGCNLANIVPFMRHMASTLQKPMCSIQNIIAGCLILLINELSVIMASNRESKRILLQI